MATDYGVDADWALDAVSEFFPWATVGDEPALCLLRGLQIPTGSIEYLPNTVDLTDFVESNASDATIQAAVEKVARSDERIIRDRVTPIRDDSGTVTITVVILTGTGPFTLVLTATEAAVLLVSLEANGSI